MILIQETLLHLKELELQIWDLEAKLKEIKEVKVLKFQIDFLDSMSQML